MATEKRYSVSRIIIARPYSKDGDYDAVVNVATMYGDEIKLKLPEDRVEAILDSVSDLILDALTAQFTNMKEDFQHHIEQKKLAALPPVSVEAESTTVVD